MTIKASGPLSASEINIELDRASTSRMTIGDSVVRSLLKKASGSISFSNAYGKGTTTFVFSKILDTIYLNYNIRNEALIAGWDGTSPIDATITVTSAGTIGSTSTLVPAFATDVLPVGSKLVIINNGFIIGCGGAGGQGGGSTGAGAGFPGGSGGTAIEISGVPTKITNNNTIRSGGGGGGGGAATYNSGASGGGGGGGRGYYGGVGGNRGTGQSFNGVAGAAGALGAAGNGGKGGGLNPGLGGSGNTVFDGGGGGAATYNSTAPGGGGGGGGGNSGAGGEGGSSAWYTTNQPGGAGGIAVNGNATVTWLATGALYGPLV